MMYSRRTAKQILETAIDGLVDSFAREPYIHRCEHSIHCELYAMLTVHRALQGLYQFKDTEGRCTTLVHKEWPETQAREDKQGRRGNFDIAILAPAEILRHTTKDFTSGHIRPAFVVEMGLNYGLDHLRQDDAKLSNSRCCDAGYLVHLWQPHKGIADADVARLRDWLPCAKSHVAAVVFTASGPLIKHLKESTLVQRSEDEEDSQQAPAFYGAPRRK